MLVWRLTQCPLWREFGRLENEGIRSHETSHHSAKKDSRGPLGACSCICLPFWIWSLKFILNLSCFDKKSGCKCFHWPDAIAANHSSCHVTYLIQNGLASLFPHETSKVTKKKKMWTWEKEALWLPVICSSNDALGPQAPPSGQTICLNSSGCSGWMVSRIRGCCGTSWHTRHF